MWEQAMRDYLKEHPCQYGITSVTSMLEFLWDHYTNENPVDSTQIRSGFRELDALAETLSWEDQNQISEMVVRLCLDHERQAFTEGIFVGAKLMAELMEREKRQ